jgi:hypothetical protein
VGLFDEFFDSGGPYYGEWFRILDLCLQHHNARNAKTVIGVEMTHRQDIQPAYAYLGFFQSKLGAFTGVENVHSAIEPNRQ